MSTNFKISTRIINEDLHLELSGDFDGSSACELANKIMVGHEKNRQIIINCEKLRKVLPFGARIFNYLMKSPMMPVEKMIFEGTKGVEIRYLNQSANKERDYSGSRRYTTRCSIM